MSGPETMDEKPKGVDWTITDNREEEKKDKEKSRMGPQEKKSGNGGPSTS